MVQHCYSTGGWSCNPRQLAPELMLPTMGLAAPPMNRLPPTTMGNTLDMSRLQYLPQGSGGESSRQRWKGEMLQVMMQLPPGLTMMAAMAWRRRRSTHGRRHQPYTPSTGLGCNISQWGVVGSDVGSDRKGGYCCCCSCRALP